MPDNWRLGTCREAMKGSLRTMRYKEKGKNKRLLAGAGKFESPQLIVREFAAAFHSSPAESLSGLNINIVSIFDFLCPYLERWRLPS
jgi:hypothetical protein